MLFPIVNQSNFFLDTIEGPEATYLFTYPVIIVFHVYKGIFLDTKLHLNPNPALSQNNAFDVHVK